MAKGIEERQEGGFYSLIPCAVGYGLFAQFAADIAKNEGGVASENGC